jgi:toxin ParE1/3/4
VSLGYALTLQAQDDLADLWNFYERISKALADRKINAVLEEIEELVAFPEMGRSREDIKLGLRVWSSGKHLIFYRVTQSELLIERVIHGHQDIEALFRADD